MRNTGTITGVKAVGSFILVEHLTEEEVMNTRLCLPKKDEEKGGNQAYIIDIGPALEREKWGFEIGQRVLLQGSFVPVPKVKSNGRKIGVVSPHDIKAVFLEKSRIDIE